MLAPWSFRAEFWSGVLERSIGVEPDFGIGKSRMECSCDVCVCNCSIPITRLHKTWPHTHTSQLHSILLVPLQNLTPLLYNTPLQDSTLWNTQFYEQRASTFTTPKFDSTPLQYSTPKLCSKTPLHRIHDFMSKEQVLLPLQNLTPLHSNTPLQNSAPRLPLHRIHGAN